MTMIIIIPGDCSILMLLWLMILLAYELVFELIYHRFLKTMSICFCLLAHEIELFTQQVANKGTITLLSHVPGNRLVLSPTAAESRALD